MEREHIQIQRRRENTYNLTIPSATIILMLHIIIYYINIKIITIWVIYNYIMKKQPDLLLYIIIHVMIKIED